jgi:DNA mismatch repair ATPase MutS
MLRERQRTVTFLMQPGNRELVTGIGKQLRKMRDVPRILGRLLNASATVGDWMMLFEVGVKIRSNGSNSKVYRVL